MNINATLIGQMMAFAVFVWITMKYIWPPIVKAMEDRKAKIAAGLAEAERGHHAQKLSQEKAKQTLHEAKQQASEIVVQAQKRASEIIEESKGAARVEGERILTAAQAEIEHEINKAREELRGKMAELAVAGAEKILHKEINAAEHKRIIDSLAKQI
jgi:F-type H+-transporting ATPase subunit b